MRSRRFSFLAGWLAVVVLAIAGVAAFAGQDPSGEQVQAEAAAEAMGHTSGAYAGLAFAVLGGASSTASGTATGDEAETTDVVVVPESAATPTESGGDPLEEIGSVSGWLSEVEVRALVSLYFQPDDVNRAIRVAWCESRFDTDAVSLRTGGIGLFQHLPKYWAERASNAGFSGYEATHAEASVAAAAWEVYNGGGWNVFGCRG